MTLRPDLAIIARHVPRDARVLDVGCGDGALLAALRDERQVDARGIEIDAGNVAVAMARGLSVVQGDADLDLAGYPAAAFDYAILSQTIQTSRVPARALDELLRIAGRVFVSFPNFGHWRVRAALGFGGRMPVTRTLPDVWHETANIHHLTIGDFRALLAGRGVLVERAWFLAGGRARPAAFANLLAEQAIFLIGAR